ncbi:MAG: Hsp20/alpha crystallin family protein [Clostridia bacterium]|nr:Hsp20/alpha crystallin family protein [Clostridia bacterium]
MKYYITRRNNNQDFIDQAFNSFFRPFFTEDSSSFMKTDVRETETTYEMEIEMPGFTREQINISLENGYITVSAKQEQKSQDKYLKRERATSFSRSYYVGEVNKEQIKAKYESGVLTVSVPKEQQKICHSINID